MRYSLENAQCRMRRDGALVEAQPQTEAVMTSEDERLVLILAGECHDLDDILSVLRTLSQNAVRLGALKTDPIVLAGFAKKLRGEPHIPGLPQ